MQNQTLGNYEHIILDDGSTDGTEDLMRRYSDKRIVYVKRKHVGLNRLVEVYNDGLKLARGDFIAILEADDFYPRDKLETQVNYMFFEDAVLSFGQVVEIDEAHSFLGVNPTVNAFRNTQDWFTPLLIRDYITAVTVMMRKEALLSIGGFKQPEGASCVDYYTFLELALHGKFLFVPHVLGYWVKHGRNLSDRNLAPDLNYKFIISFCKTHGIAVPWRELSRQKGKNLFHVGRHHLLNRNRREALRCFKKAFLLSSFLGKLKACYGIFSAVLDTDLEWAAKTLGRPMERKPSV